MKRQVKQLLLIAMFIIQKIFVVSCSQKVDEKQTKLLIDKSVVKKSSSIPDTTKAPNFTIADVDDISYSTVVRLSYKIKVDRKINDDEIRAICQKIISQMENNRSYNAITFAFYLPDSDIKNSHYTAGNAVWAPFGEWNKAKAVATGDYSYHQLIVQSGNALGDIPESEISVLPTEMKKKIYYELVLLEDQGMNAEKSNRAIANKYTISLEEVKKIAIEGTVNGWAMPPAK